MLPLSQHGSDRGVPWSPVRRLVGTREKTQQYITPVGACDGIIKRKARVQHVLRSDVYQVYVYRSCRNHIVSPTIFSAASDPRQQSTQPSSATPGRRAPAFLQSWISCCFTLEPPLFTKWVNTADSRAAARASRTAQNSKQGANDISRLGPLLSKNIQSYVS